jgi:type I restriction enzyme M protein
LPQNYTRLDKDLLVSLLKNFAAVPMDIDGDAFGKIYEYFLGKFAMSEGQKGGEFFTPISIVKLIVEIIEPFHGRILDPACGSGGMFVQSAAFVERHKKSPISELSIFGQEKTEETIRLCKMNLAVHGLSGDIKDGNTYYVDRHDSLSKASSPRHQESFRNVGCSR